MHLFPLEEGKIIFFTGLVIVCIYTVFAHVESSLLKVLEVVNK